MSKHEQSDVHVPSLVRFGAVLAVLVVFAMVAMWLLFRYLADQPTGPAAAPMTESRELPPAPRLQVDPAAQLQVVREAEQGVLHGYGWVDRDAGLVRIPIDRAMDLLAERGLPETAAPAEEQ